MTCLKNDNRLEVNNGTIGTITDFSDSHMVIKVIENNASRKVILDLNE